MTGRRSGTDPDARERGIVAWGSLFTAVIATVLVYLPIAFVLSGLVGDPSPVLASGQTDLPPEGEWTVANVTLVVLLCTVGLWTFAYLPAAERQDTEPVLFNHLLASAMGALIVMWAMWLPIAYVLGWPLWETPTTGLPRLVHVIIGVFGIITGLWSLKESLTETWSDPYYEPVEMRSDE